MGLIYEPKGKAREYSPLALNVYTGGCDHACKYCYCANIIHGWGSIPHPRNLAGLQKEANKSSKQILLSFMSDPYCMAETVHNNTLMALNILFEAGCSVAILTKGGSRCLRDIDLFKRWPENRIKVGATLTFKSSNLSELWEPGASLPRERIESLKALHDEGIKTWASIEPVINIDESLSIINESLPYVDLYKIGKWNHDIRSNQINWSEFGTAAVNMVRSAGKELYVKKDLASHFDTCFLSGDEIDMDRLNLPIKEIVPTW